MSETESKLERYYIEETDYDVEICDRLDKGRIIATTDKAHGEMICHALNADSSRERVEELEKRLEQLGVCPKCDDFNKISRKHDRPQFYCRCGHSWVAKHRSEK